MMTPAEIAALSVVCDFAEKLAQLEIQVAAWAEVERARMAQYLARCAAKYSNGQAVPSQE